FMLGAPPISTFVPYTTLFRSIMQLERRRSDSWWWVLFRDVSLLVDNTTFRHLTARDVTPLQGLGMCIRSLPWDKPHGWVWDTRQDRKSTRLNSSHVKISYAVF